MFFLLFLLSSWYLPVFVVFVVVCVFFLYSCFRTVLYVSKYLLLFSCCFTTVVLWCRLFVFIVFLVFPCVFVKVSRCFCELSYCSFVCY